LRINLLYELKEDCQRDFPPTVRHIYLDNIQSQNSKYGILIDGLPSNDHVYDIHVSNCVFNGVKSGNKISGAEEVHFNSLMINGEIVEL